MKSFFRLIGLLLLLGCAQSGWSQTPGVKVDRVDIKYVGPTNVSEQFVRSNIRLKAGGIFRPNSSQTADDIHSLFDTGQFENVQVSVDPADDGGVVVAYIVQARLRITDIKITGNKKLGVSKIR